MGIGRKARVGFRFIVLNVQLVKFMGFVLAFTRAVRIDRYAVNRPGSKLDLPVSEPGPPLRVITHK